MEVCGGQTHAIVRFGLDEMLPPRDHPDPRPGLPGVRHADRDHRQGRGHRRPAGGDLLLVRRHAPRARLAEGPAHGEVGRGRRADRLLADGRRGPGPQASRTGRSCSSPSASRPPPRPTRWPSSRRRELGLENFSVLVSHVLVPPAMRAVLDSPAEPRAGLPGRRTRLHDHRHGRVPADRRAVPRADRGHRLRAGGHPAGRADVRRAAGSGPARGREPVRPQRPPRGQPAGACGRSPRSSEPVPRKWRGIGEIPASGLALREPYAAFDAERRFGVAGDHGRRAGRVHRRRDAAGTRSRTIVRPSASAARPSARWAPRWFPPKGPVPPTIATAATRREWRVARGEW